MEWERGSENTLKVLTLQTKQLVLFDMNLG